MAKPVPAFIPDPCRKKGHINVTLLQCVCRTYVSEMLQLRTKEEETGLVCDD
jgi:hypothetical protein